MFVGSGSLTEVVIVETTAASLVCSGSGSVVSAAAPAAAAAALGASLTTAGTGAVGARGTDAGAGIRGTEVIAASGIPTDGSGNEMGGKLKPDDREIGTAGAAPATSPLGSVVVRSGGRVIGDGSIVGWRGAIDANKKKANKN